MKRIFLCVLAMLLCVGVSTASAIEFDLSLGRGTTIGPNEDTQGAIFHEFDVADQTSVSSGTGVILPFLTIQANTLEHAFNSDYNLVLDATRPHWNQSITVGDLYQNAYNPDFPGYFEFLLDINQSASNSLLTQHELQVYRVPEAYGGALSDFGDVTSSGTLLWDLNAGPQGDSTILLDYNLWSGSGQNIDVGFYLPIDLFEGGSLEDYVYLYAQFGEFANPGGFPSNAGFEEYVLRGNPVPEAATMLLLGSGLVGLAGFRRKFRKG